MFITCQECNTTFRLDERLLKPTGSKVRCSQCRYTFIAMPESGRPMARSVQALSAKSPPLSESRAPAAAIAEPEGKELEGIDLAELDAILEGTDVSGQSPHEASAGSEAEEASDLDEIDIDFDFDSALDTHTGEVEAEPAGDKDASEEIDLDMDFEINDDTLISEEVEGMNLEAPVDDDNRENKTAGSAISGESSLEDDLDMAFEDLDLESEEGIGQAAGKTADGDQKSDDLDLDDLDFDLDDVAPKDEPDGEEPELSLAKDLDLGMDKPSPAESAPKEDGSKATDDLGLDLDFDLDDAAAELKLSAEEPELNLDDEQSNEDIDLSDLDSLLESADEKVDDGADEPRFQIGDDLDLDLEMEPAAITDSAAAGSSDEELEDLEFELDTEFEEKSAANTPAAAEADGVQTEEDEIDLSDIEQMLGGEGEALQRTGPVPIADEDLGLGGSDEIDLAEIESAIDEADSVSEDAATRDEELELDLDIEKPATTAEPSDDLQLDLSLKKDEAPSVSQDLDLELELESDEPISAGDTVDLDNSELDLSDLSDLVEEEERATKPETIDSGDIELEFQIEEDESPAIATSTSTGAARVAGKELEIPIEQTMETLAVEEPTVKPKQVKPKKKTSKTLVVLFVLVLLGGIGYGLYYAVMQMGIEIPYVSDYLNPKPKDPAGTMNLSTLDINSKFIDNSQAGRLFVITGKVRNGYSTQRTNIRLQGRLFKKGKQLVKTEFSYAGTMIDDQDLASLPIAEIKQRLNTVPQPGETTGTASPGQNLSFMVVFSDLPPADQLDEFAVELVSSAPGQ